MKVNNGKKHLEMSRKQPKLTAKVKVNKSKHESQNVEEFLGYDTDSIFTFENHINKICKNTG